MTNISSAGTALLSNSHLLLLLAAISRFASLHKDRLLSVSVLCVTTSDLSWIKSAVQNKLASIQLMLVHLSFTMQCNAG